MKNMNLMTADLHDFSDIDIRIPRGVALLGIVLACVAVLYGLFGPTDATGPMAKFAFDMVSGRAAPPA